MWKTTLEIAIVIGGCVLVYSIIKSLIAGRKKTNKEKPSKEVTEEMAKKIIEDARMHRQARNVDENSS